MRQAVLETIILIVTFLTCHGRRRCTYRSEIETAGNHNDWAGFKTVGDIAACMQFCDSVPLCVAAEYVSDTNDCYIYYGPTTLKYSKQRTFMTRQCKEVPGDPFDDMTTETPATVEVEGSKDVTTDMSTVVNSTVETTSPPTPETTSSTTAKPTPPTISTTTTQITLTTSLLTTLPTTTSTSSTTPLKSLDKIGDVTTSHEIRTKRSASTPPNAISRKITRRLTRQHASHRRKSKSKMPASLMVKMLHKDKSVPENLGLPQTTMEYTSPRPTVTPKPFKIRRKKYDKPLAIMDETTTMFPSTESSLTPSTSSNTTTPVPETNKRPRNINKKDSRRIQASGTFDLKITDDDNDVRIKSDNPIEKSPSLVKVTMKTSSYRPDTLIYGNRINPQPSSIARGCYYPCRQIVGMQQRYGVFVPFAQRTEPRYRPKSHQQHPRFNPSYRVRIPFRVRLPLYTRYVQSPSIFAQRRSHIYDRRSYVPYGYGYQPRHGAVAWYGPQYQQMPAHNPWHRQVPAYVPRYQPNPKPMMPKFRPSKKASNPWANNFKKASLESPKTHQVAVIPGGRHNNGGHRRMQQPPVSKSAQRKKSGDLKLNDQAKIPVKKQTHAKRPPPTSGSRLRSEVRSGKGSRSGDRKKVGSKTSTSKSNKWELKNHYNTYTLRLKLPEPISGHKRCYQRQQLPPPPKILIVAYKPDGRFSVMALPVSYPKQICAFVNPGKLYPELRLPLPMVIFTGTEFVKDKRDLNKIYMETARRASYDLKALQRKSTMFKYTMVYNTPALFRQMKLPIVFSRSKVSYEMTRMGFIYRFTVRLPKVMSSRNTVVQDTVSEHVTSHKVEPREHRRRHRRS